MIGLSQETINHEGVKALEVSLANMERVIIWPPEAKELWAAHRKTLAALVEDQRRLEWLIRHQYVPAKWRPATREDLHAGRGLKNGMICLGEGTRAEIDAAMKEQAERHSAANFPAHVESDQPKTP